MVRLLHVQICYLCTVLAGGQKLGDTWKPSETAAPGHVYISDPTNSSSGVQALQNGDAPAQTQLPSLFSKAGTSGKSDFKLNFTSIFERIKIATHKAEKQLNETIDGRPTTPSEALATTTVNSIVVHANPTTTERPPIAVSTSVRPANTTRTGSGAETTSATTDEVIIEMLDANTTEATGVFEQNPQNPYPTAPFMRRPIQYYRPANFLNASQLTSTWTEWSGWTECMEGKQYRVRGCYTFQGFQCSGSKMDNRPCNMETNLPTGQSEIERFSAHEQKNNFIAPTDPPAAPSPPVQLVVSYPAPNLTQQGVPLYPQLTAPGPVGPGSVNSPAFGPPPQRIDAQRPSSPSSVTNGGTVDSRVSPVLTDMIPRSPNAANGPLLQPGAVQDKTLKSSQ